MDNIGYIDEKSFESLLEKAFIRAAEAEFSTISAVGIPNVSDKTNSQILSAIRESEKRKNLRKKWLVKVLATAAAVVFAVFGVRLFMPDVFSAVENKITSFCNEYISVIFAGETAGEKEALAFDEVYFSKLPKGFTLSSCEKTDTYCSYTLKKLGRTVTVTVSHAENMSIGYDSEHGKVEKITMNGLEAALWLDEERGYGAVSFASFKTGVVISGEVSREELLDIAENIELYQINESKGSSV